MQVQYPLHLSFKIIAFGPQIYISDASGSEVLFVHQKALKLREDINVFNNRQKSQTLFHIKADRIIDFSANYHFTDAMGNPLGSIKREGMRSIFKASYNVMDASGMVIGHIKEDNAWVKVIDALLGELPVIGIFSGYFFNPSYTLYRGMDESVPAMQLKKQPALFEGKFEMQKAAEPMNEGEETLWQLAFLMMVLLERARG